MLYGLETVALMKRQEAEMEVAELKSEDVVIRSDKNRNENIILRWYGHLRRKYDGYIGRRMLRMELPGKRKWRKA